MRGAGALPAPAFGSGDQRAYRLGHGLDTLRARADRDREAGQKVRRLIAGADGRARIADQQDGHVEQPGEDGLKTKLFNDWGVIGPPKALKDNSTIQVLESQAIRGSAGVGVEWTSPVGIISLDYSPFIFGAQSFDRTTKFRVNFGNRLN